MIYKNLAARLAANSKRARNANQFDPATGRTLKCACRLWTGNLNNSGYPRFSERNDLGAVVKKYAHRAAYEIATGKKVPSNMTLDHLCVNESCIEPTHLQVVSMKTNTDRRVLRTALSKLAA